MTSQMRAGARIAAVLVLASFASPATATAPERPSPPGTAFAVDLYKALRAGNGNLAFSPASVEMALAMTWAGARTGTAMEMARVLRVSGPPEVALPAVRARVGRMADGTRSGVTLRMANRLFPEKSYALQKAYVDRMAAIGAPLEALDFRHAPDAARNRINTWVAEQTADRITNLLPAGSVSGQTRLAIVNAIYLLADWSDPFTKETTQPRPFHARGGAPADVPTMHRRGPYLYAEADGVKLLQMPYVGHELAMVLVLPDRVDGLPAVETALDPVRLAGWLDALKPERVVAVAVPKFTIDPSAPIDLRPILESLGMSAAFDLQRADFTGIAAPPSPADRLAVSRVYHKAFVKVDEKGTEAAAATAVLMQRVGSAAVPEKPKEFKADHPFLFLIRDLKTGALLFMGRVNDPIAR